MCEVSGIHQAGVNSVSQLNGDSYMAATFICTLDEGTVVPASNFVRKKAALLALTVRLDNSVSL